MKKFISTIIAVAVPALFAAAPLRGQESTASTASPPAENPFSVATPEEQLIQDEARRAQSEAEKQIRQARRQLDRAQVQVAQAESDSQARRASEVGMTSGGPSSGPNQFSDRLVQVIQRASGGDGGPGRTLVIRSGDGEPGTQAAIEEDLAVMSHIFNKAIAEKVGGGDRERTVMGINVYFGPNPDSVRNLYLEGYGALFTLKVNFPLLAPPKVSEEQKEKSPATSEWDEAKRELAARDDTYGADRYGTLRAIPTRTVRYPAPFEAGEEYNEQKVTQLKDALLASLKSAANIRNLKSDDAITLCVFGGTGASSYVYRTSSNVRVAPTKIPPAPPGQGVPSAPAVDPTTGLPQVKPVPTARVSASPGRGSILTIRVKKSDVDAFAKGKLDLDMFRKKASVTIYPAGSDSGSSQAY